MNLNYLGPNYESMNGIVEECQYITAVKGSRRHIFLYGDRVVNNGWYVYSDFGIETIDTKCNYGGYREWLICPICRKKRLTLYYVNDGFKCRVCGRLLYDKQRESKKGRISYAIFIDWMKFKYRREQATRPYYNGILTKRAQKLIADYNRIMETTKLIEKFYKTPY